MMHRNNLSQFPLIVGPAQRYRSVNDPYPPGSSGISFLVGIQKSFPVLYALPMVFKVVMQRSLIPRLPSLPRSTRPSDVYGSPEA
jgi:hypothetical protein